MKKKCKFIIVVFTLIIVIYSLTISSSALTYTSTDNAVSVQFAVPDGWVSQALTADTDLSDDINIIKERYVYTGDNSEFILFGFCDLASIGPMLKEQGAPDHYINSKAYMAAAIGADADTINIVNYHGIDYYQFKADSSTRPSGAGTAPALPGACTVIKLFCVINTTMFTFQYSTAMSDFKHFADFEQLLNNVVYTIPADSNNLEIYKLDRTNQSNQVNDPSFNPAILIMLYSLPFFIYGYSKRKINGLR